VALAKVRHWQGADNEEIISGMIRVEDRSNTTLLKVLVYTVAIWLLATGVLKLIYFNTTSATVLRHWIIPSPYHQLAVLYHSGFSIVLGSLLLIKINGISKITALSAIAVLWAISLVYGFVAVGVVGFASNCGCLGGAIILPLWVSMPLDVGLFIVVVYALYAFKGTVQYA